MYTVIWIIMFSNKWFFTYIIHLSFGYVHFEIKSEILQEFVDFSKMIFFSEYSAMEEFNRDIYDCLYVEKNTIFLFFYCIKKRF